jgi:hypothetical protein
MKFYFSILIIISLLLGFSACSELNNDVSQPAPVSVHKEGIGDPGSENFHTKSFQANGWNLQSCAECHGAEYGGGVTGSSCLDCHTQPGGPEACNTCHGDFADGSMIAPPTDLLGNIETTIPGVGAHSIHSYGAVIAQVVDCYECHPGATGDEKYVFSHVGALPADIQFGSFTNSNGVASYNFDNYSCANTYCHGNFVFNKADAASNAQFAYTADQMTGNNYSPIWNIVDGTQAQCGTCHGEIANDGTLVSAVPNGHLAAQLTGCVGCHPGVVDADGNIVDPVKHINGQRNVFGN